MQRPPLPFLFNPFLSLPLYIAYKSRSQTILSWKWWTMMNAYNFSTWSFRRSTVVHIIWTVIQANFSIPNHVAEAFTNIYNIISLYRPWMKFFHESSFSTSTTHNNIVVSLVNTPCLLLPRRSFSFLMEGENSKAVQSRSAFMNLKIFIFVIMLQLTPPWQLPLISQGARFFRTWLFHCGDFLSHHVQNVYFHSPYPEQK